MKQKVRRSLRVSIAPEGSDRENASAIPLEEQLEDTVEETEHRSQYDWMSDSPFIPDTVFKKLPQLLQDCCKPFDDRRERDVMLVSAITVLSGCFPSVSGLYAGSIVYPNLYAFIIAPPASGKGAVKFAKAMGMVLHESLKDESKKEQITVAFGFSDTEPENAESKSKTAQGSSTTKSKETKLPKVLFIPANTSASAIIHHLKTNGENGIVVETEADTMVTSLRQDWGNFSDLLRKAFHHESVSMSRVNNNQYIDLQCPKLSVLLSGTPSQVQGLITSAEDGLFSRFMFYLYRVAPYWRDVSPANNSNLTTYFNEISERVKLLADAYKVREVTIDLTADQWVYLNSAFKGWIKNASEFVSEDAASTVKRLGLILFRIAMVLTVIRAFETEKADIELVCCNDDFNTAYHLVSVLIRHAMILYPTLPKANIPIDNRNKHKFLAALPSDREFSRQDAVAIGLKLGIQPRTVDKYLKSFIGKYLQHAPRHGFYEKIT